MTGDRSEYTMLVQMAGPIPAARSRAALRIPMIRDILDLKPREEA